MKAHSRKRNTLHRTHRTTHSLTKSPLRFARHMHKRGFTILEIMVVVAIISVLALAGMAGFAKATAAARDGKRRADLETVRNALASYRAENGGYPYATSFSNLVTTLSTGGYITSSSTIADPRNNVASGYVYSYTPSGGTCSGAAVCTTYTMTAKLEKTTGSTGYNVTYTPTTTVETTFTPTPTPSGTPTQSASPTSSGTPKPTSPVPSATVVVETPVPTPTPTATPSPTPTATPSPAATPSCMAVNTGSCSSSATTLDKDPWRACCLKPGTNTKYVCNASDPASGTNTCREVSCATASTNVDCTLGTSKPCCPGLTCNTKSLRCETATVDM